MFKIIRVASDYSVVVLVTSLSGEPYNPGNKYFLYNSNLLEDSETKEMLADAGDADAVFIEVKEGIALQYLSGIADGLGWGELAVNDFPSLSDAWQWIREAQKIAAKALEQNLIRDATFDPTLLDILVEHFGRDEMVEHLERSRLSMKDKQRILERYPE